MSSQKGLKLGGGHPKITKKQAEILDTIITTSLTPKQIAQRRGVSIQAVYKIIRQLKEKGLISKRFKKTDPPLRYHPPITSGIRLHAEEYNIKIIDKTLKYEQHRATSNTLTFDNNTIRLYNKSIEVYSGQSFIGKTTSEANRKSIEYWGRFWLKLENLLGVTLIKDKKNNIKIVNQHYSDINNEIAQSCEKTGDKIRIKAKEDGKTAYLIDNSFNLHEFEAIHPETSKQDIEKAEKHFQDWRTNNPPTNSEIMNLIKVILENQKEQSSGLLSVIKLISPPIVPNNDKQPKGRIDKADYIG